MRDTTLLFLVKYNDSKITEICLAMKKRGFGAGRYNGVGGKLDEGEQIIDAARRETLEEIGVRVGELDKKAELTFFTPHHPSWNQIVHVYFVSDWEGDPKESEEMRPEWFKIEDIPYQNMWPDDKFWLPEVLNGKFVTGTFTFAEDGSIASQKYTAISPRSKVVNKIANEKQDR